MRAISIRILRRSLPRPIPPTRFATTVFCSGLAFPQYPEWDTGQGEEVDSVVRRYPMALSGIPQIRQGVCGASEIANPLKGAVRLRLVPHDWV